MLQYYNTYRVLQQFFNSPRKQFYLRELSRLLKLGPVSTTNNLKQLLKEKLIIRIEKGLYPTYSANRENDYYKLLKKQNTTLQITRSGLLQFIDETIRPECIILFGSASRGEDHEESDIDLFIQAKETTLQLKPYENILHRKINILFEKNIKNLSKELLNNIINGTILYGYLKVL
ncbi:MAG TPA: nucleotidyltransferase domain-containing protein [Candidatus Nanoarchaeia archaeon]|nr:nucleotidyltransferase domain-containing protein [Candidatus Nanoarchaeia archaeon]